ncbi:MAG: hypothetical protein K8R23_08030 [Chthoniobacter sp.]|nr:hypothetical protein [Chthoniobacter sp.]
MIRFVRLLLPSSLLAGIAVALFGFAPFSGPDRLADSLLFEFALDASAAGALRLESVRADPGFPPETALADVPAGAPASARFLVPAGAYRAFRLTVAGRAGGAKVTRARIADLTGKEVASFAGERFRAADDGGALELDCNPPLVLRSSLTADGWQSAALVVALTLVLALASWRGAVPLEKLRAAALAQAGQWVRRARAHPYRTLFGTAVAAVVVSCHPVIFGGQSFVSPNNGAGCLYAGWPTLPGAPAGPVENPKFADIGAMLWAHLPYSVIEHRAIFHDHELPLWNRANSCGVPLLGQGQSMIGDPLHWIPLVAGGAAWAWDVKFVLAKILFAFGSGLLGRAAVGRLGVAALLAASSAFLGFFAYRFNHAAIFSLSYAPWILLAWLEIARAAGGRAAARWAGLLIAANWMELNSGTAKEASMLIAALNATGLISLLLRRENWPSLSRKLAAAACGMLIFLLLSAPCWLVFLDSLGRAWTTYNVPRAYQIQSALLLGLFDDLFYRQTIARENHANPSANFLVLLGVLWAVVRYRALWPEATFRALALMAATMTALVFGVVPPALLVRLPLVGNISHVDNTFSCVLIVLLLPLAGFGLRAGHARLAAAEWRDDWVATLLLGAVLVGAFLGSVQAATRSPFALQPETTPVVLSGFFLGYAAALLLAVAVLPLVARRLLLANTGTVFHLLLAVLALGALHFRHGMYGPTKFDAYVMNPQARVDLQARSPMIEHLQRLTAEPARVAGFGEVLTPGFNAVLGLDGIAGPDALVSAYYREFVDAAKLPVVWDWRITVRPDTTPALRPFHDLLNLRYYLAMPSPTPAAVAGLRRIGTADLDLYESPTAWPRAFFTNSLTRYGTVADFTEYVWKSDGRPLAALQDGTAWPGELPTAADRQFAPAHDYRLTNNTTTFTIDAPARGIAVLTESFEEGNFRVTVNGAPSAYVRVNHAFCGVPIPRAGKFVVRCEYWPRRLTPALWLAAAGLALLLGGALWLRLSRAT